MNASAEKTTPLPSKTEKLLKANDLIYITEEKLIIERHKKGTGFYYTKNGRKISDKKKLERFKKLVIPPAWKEVKICGPKNGHLQVVGRDSKNRKVYRYHPLWTELQNETKFLRMAEFGKILPKIRKQIAKDLKLRGMPQRKVLALVIQLMEETHFRIGNQYYADENKSFGLTTLRSKHVEFSGNKMKFEFIGKKGKLQTATLKDKKLIKLVNRCEEIPVLNLCKAENREKLEKFPLESSLERIDVQVTRLTRLIFEMLDLSRLEDQTLEFKRTPFSLNKPAKTKPLKKPRF